MGKEVYANGHEISAEKDSNQSMGAMPDVCLSPPSPPAGPVPIPYPNFSKGSDTDKGSKSVKVQGEQVGKKNNSDYKNSKGDEAATKSFGMGVISHNLSGPMQHEAWSMDVKIEGKNAIRQLDLTSHNHASPASNAAMMVNGGKFNVAPRKSADCSELQQQNKDAQAEAHPRIAAAGERPVVREGETIASAHYTPPTGPSYTINGCSNESDIIKKNDGWARGYKKANGDYQNTKLCADAKKQFEYSGQNPNQGPMAHAEARIVETLMGTFGSNPGGTLVLRIQQRGSGTTRLSSDPCESCHDMLCAAGKCGLKILLCETSQSDPEPVPNCPK
jgi:hypothetical protein